MHASCKAACEWSVVVCVCVCVCVASVMAALHTAAAALALLASVSSLPREGLASRTTGAASHVARNSGVVVSDARDALSEWLNAGVRQEFFGNAVMGGTPTSNIASSPLSGTWTDAGIMSVLWTGSINASKSCA